MTSVRRSFKLSPVVRQRRLLRSLAYSVVLVLAAIFGWQHMGPTGRAKDDWTAFDHQSYMVSRVVDGDTIHIRPSATGPETIVRLLGIDAPELHDPSTGQPAHWAERSKSYLESRAEGKTVTLRLEPIETRDRYDRLLAYVYLSDSDCINLDLIHDGEAYADRRFRHTYRPQYEQAENDARRNLRGLWKDLTENDMPPWRRVWLHQHDDY
ncbi:MAG TPA: thermonuclease family protein [Tepidisphaeraceae bacterium]|nr:thermonuclease family protein [Tepidisphaeraceae bacterium]